MRFNGLIVYQQCGKGETWQECFVLHHNGFEVDNVMLNLYIAVKIIKGSLVLFAQIIIIAVNSRYDGTWHDDCGMWISPSEKLFLFVTQPAIELVQVASFVGIFFDAFCSLPQAYAAQEGSCIGRFQLVSTFSEQEKRWHKCNPSDNIETLFYPK